MKIQTCIKFRHVFSKFSSSCHNLEIELGRHSDRPKNERICRLCDDGIEDELHFRSCSVYDTLRAKYSPRKYHVAPNMNKFNQEQSHKLLDSTIYRCLAVQDIYNQWHHVYLNAFKLCKEYLTVINRIQCL